MANLNIDAFSEEYKEVAPKECAAYLIECVSKEDKEELKEKWQAAGGYKVIPWWKWCLDNIEVNVKREKTLEEKIQFIKNMQKNTIDDDYDDGFYNGIEYCLSVLENREANYRPR